LAELVADYQFDDSNALEKARQVAERFSASTNPLLLDTLAWFIFGKQHSLAQTMMERALSQSQTLRRKSFHYGADSHESVKPTRPRQTQQALATDTVYPGMEEAKKIILFHEFIKP